MVFCNGFMFFLIFFLFLFFLSETFWGLRLFLLLVSRYTCRHCYGSGGEGGRRILVPREIKHTITVYFSFPKGVRPCGICAKIKLYMTVTSWDFN